MKDDEDKGLTHLRLKDFAWSDWDFMSTTYRLQETASCNLRDKYEWYGNPALIYMEILYTEWIIAMYAEAGT
jgi:hypothetical protein